ncbi:MAG TPA: hypothetical protein PK843_06015 [bacterium]|nr:hypothetical protein [bacterium]
MQIGGLAANDALRKGHYDRYNGAFLDQAAKQDLLNAIPAAGLGIDIGLAAGVGAVGPWL